jgi:hypothetical protein
VQIIAYIDDVVLIARTRKDLVEGFRSLESAAVRIGHTINENKTECVAMNTRRWMDMPVLEIQPYTFEQVRTFACLCTVHTEDDNITEEKTPVTKKCTKRVLSSIVTHSYVFRPCWVIFRESFFVIVTLRLHFTVE